MRITVMAVLGLISASAMAQVDTVGNLETGLAIAINAAQVDASRIQLTPPQTKTLNKVIRDLRHGEEKNALKKWENLFADLVFEGSAMDVNALVQWVMRHSYIENIDDLRDQADRVRYYNSQKRAIRESVRRARTFRGLLKKLNQPTAVIDSEIESLRAYVARLEEDDQLATVDLQNILQKQQQLLQQMTNISKQLHDTALTVIGKIVG
jgi:hypothetical protein